MKLKYTLPKGLTYCPYLLDLIQGNHVLIAGTTGAGKSVLENDIIYSILCTKYPGQTENGNGARLVLIDPKRVELDIYKSLPHCLMYADNIPAIETALKNVRQIIDSRLSAMKARGQRKSEEAPIYIFIDELVDLVESDRSKSIIRLLSDSASISRATNIFFIALTQSPSRSIIPAKFKLLFNCRVALRCNNRIESQQIIDDNSALELPLHGLAVVQNNLERYLIKIPMYTDRQISDIVQHWTRQHSFYNSIFKRSAVI